MNHTDLEATLSQAAAAGFYVRSGRPVSWLNAWRWWCKHNGRRCVVAIQGSRQAVVEVDGVEVLRVKVGELEAAGARVAAQESAEPGLFDCKSGVTKAANCVK